jgi:HTH-type transcriptional regulator/antitoxin MqsA
MRHQVHAEDPAVRSLLSQVQARKSLPPAPVRKAIRVASGASVAAVAAACGVYEMTVARWENGERTPRGEHLEKYVEVLKLLQES